MSWIITGSEKTPVDPQFGSVSLLLHGEGGTIIDSSSFAHTISIVGTAGTSATQKKIGDRSISFNGFSACTFPLNANTTLGERDFTVEAWVFDTGAAVPQQIFVLNHTSSHFAACRVQINNNKTLSLLSSVTGSKWDIAATSTLTLPSSEWAHVAITRTGSSFVLYLNGQNAVSATLSGNLMRGTSNAIGQISAAGAFAFTGFMDEVRLTVGVSRYLADFTPSTAPFPDI